MLCTVKLDSDFIVELLMNRLETFWKPDKLTSQLYQDMYTNLAEEGLYDNGGEFNPMDIVDNDWVNWCSVLSKGEDTYQETLDCYEAGEYETPYGYLEATAVDNGERVFLVRSY